MKQIIKKWYDTLKFPAECTNDFENLLASAELTPCAIDEYKITGNFKKDLMMSLYFCDEAAEKAKKQGLPRDVLLETLSDIPTWTNAHYHEYNDIGLLEYGWITLGLNLYLPPIKWRCIFRRVNRLSVRIVCSHLKCLLNSLKSIIRILNMKLTTRLHGFWTILLQSF